MRRRVLYTAIIVVLMLIGAFLLVVMHHRAPSKDTVTKSGDNITFVVQNKTSSSSMNPTAAPPYDQVYASINNSLTSQDIQTSFTVTKSIVPASDWYVETLVFPDYPDTNQQVILKREGDGRLSVIAGPASIFSLSEMQAAGVPQVVMNSVAYETH